MADDARPVSLAWIGVSMAIFIATELVMGVLIGGVCLGSATSIGTGFTLQGLLAVTAYLVGGFIVGVVSPGRRMAEPAIGAFLSVFLMLMLTFLTPYSFIRFELSKLIGGGILAFGLALLGAYGGERMMGNVD
jgi:hypothetical protein